jgi:hypothetical protein
MKGVFVCKAKDKRCCYERVRSENYVYARGKVKIYPVGSTERHRTLTSSKDSKLIQAYVAGAKTIATIT